MENPATLPEARATSHPAATVHDTVSAPYPKRATMPHPGHSQSDANISATETATPCTSNHPNTGSGRLSPTSTGRLGP